RKKQSAEVADAEAPSADGATRPRRIRQLSRDLSCPSTPGSHNYGSFEGSNLAKTTEVTAQLSDRLLGQLQASTTASESTVTAEMVRIKTQPAAEGAAEHGEYAPERLLVPTGSNPGRHLKQAGQTGQSYHLRSMRHKSFITTVPSSLSPERIRQASKLAEEAIKVSKVAA
ncbi:unnamed protein product, partial [Protopolystoma xenopodis]